MPDKFGDKIRLQHALDAIATINRYVTDVNFKEFSSNSMLHDASIRQLQVIGEAFSKIGNQIREENPEVPWRQIIGLRIIVIHQYFGIDLKVIWDIIKKDLPPLQDQIQAILSALK